MKKLISISVMLVLLTGAVFAQPTIGGQLTIRAIPLAGNSIEETRANSWMTTEGVALQNGHMNVGFGDADAGGTIRFWHVNNAGNSLDWTPAAFAFAWWKPIDMLRLQIGQNPDGNFGAQQLTGWGWNAVAQSTVAVDQDNRLNVFGASDGNAVFATFLGRRSPGWYGGFNGRGATLTLTPMDDLTLAAAVPYGSGSAPAEQTYKRSHLTAIYNIPDLGRLQIAYVGGVGQKRDQGTAGNWWDAPLVDPATVYAAFMLTAIQGLRIEVGTNYTMPSETKVDAQSVGGTLVTTTTNYAWGTGLGINYDTPTFGIKTRIGYGFGNGNGRTDAGHAATVKTETRRITAVTGGVTTATVEESTNVRHGQQTFGINILPYFRMENMTLFINAGVGIRSIENYRVTSRRAGTIIGTPTDFRVNESSTIISWYANPYARVGTGNGGNFFAGLAVGNSGVKPAVGEKTVTRWAIPIGFDFNF